MTMIKRSLTPLAILLAAALTAAGAVPAKEGDGRVERAGDCSGNSNWKMKAKNDQGRTEVEFEVDQNRNGVRWNVVIRRDGNKILDTSRVTKAPSGSFVVHVRPRNRAGVQRFTAVARRASGETCRGSLRI